MVYGEKKTFEQSFKKHTYLSLNNDNSILEEQAKGKYPGIYKYDLIDNFISAILNNTPLIISQKQMLNVMQLCLDINKSLKSIKKK